MFKKGGCEITVVDRLRARNVGWDLINKYQYSHFRLHKIFNKCGAQRVHLESFISDEEQQNHFFIVKGRAGATGLLKLNRLDWDTLHFCQPMYRISFIHNETNNLAWEGLGECMLAMLISFLGEGYVDAAVDHDDYLWLNVLFDAGFRLYDSKNRYVFRAHQRPVDLRAPFLCRDFLPEDMDSVFGILKEINFAAKFSRDPFFDGRKEKVKAMYESWVRGLMSRNNCDDPVLVVERNTHVVAFGAGEKLFLPPAAEGKSVCGNSLFFCSGSAAGSYPALVHHLTTHTRKNFDALELVASITNYPAIRVLERLGLQIAAGVHSLAIKL
ncbi:hypothetical protein [Alcanivorax jadensis]|uniref:hypothetical protein n=1 Tax=Alcanivorax jadensis TaxID=64988 RepID=UPI002408F5B7|nr:hypothetical protein [Alcanivorax jadensis]MDF1637857.1 hypothetical protein [Alcanivorax jadensis]